MVDVDEGATAGKERDVYLRAAIADHVVMVLMMFLEHAWPWWSEQLEDMLDCDPHMAESERGVLILLPPK